MHAPQPRRFTWALAAAAVVAAITLAFASQPLPRYFPPRGELAVGARAPAGDPAVAAQRAGMRVARRDALNPEDAPATVTGAYRSAAEPSPTWPDEFVPQHIAAPSFTAHVCAPPAAMAVAPEDNPTTSSGTR